MEPFLIAFIAVVVVSWALVGFVVWAILAGAERQARQERAERQAHPTTPNSKEENDE
jgi:hypothetical protein